MFEWIHSSFENVIRIALLIASPLLPTAPPARSVQVRYRGGVRHGFLVLRTSDGKPVADGDSTQLKFTDGSVYEQTTAFSQRGNFQLLKDHAVHKGPQFKLPMEAHRARS
jgi:hypothetical protein